MVKLCAKNVWIGEKEQAWLNLVGNRYDSPNGQADAGDRGGGRALRCVESSILCARVS